MDPNFGDWLLGLVVPQQKQKAPGFSQSTHPYHGPLLWEKNPTILIKEPDIRDSLMAYLRDYLSNAEVARQPVPAEFMALYRRYLLPTLYLQTMTNGGSVEGYVALIFDFCSMVLKEFGHPSPFSRHQVAADGVSVLMDDCVCQQEPHVPDKTPRVLETQQQALEAFMPLSGRRVCWTAAALQTDDHTSMVFKLAAWTGDMGVPISFPTDGRQYYLFRQLKDPQNPHERIFSRSDATPFDSLEYGFFQMVLALLLYIKEDRVTCDPIPIPHLFLAPLVLLPLCDPDFQD